MEPESHVGRRVRELRVWRGLSQRQLAGLAGMSQPNLSNIERGLQAAERKATLEALASALQVSPAELTGQPFEAATPEEMRGQAAVNVLRGVLRDITLGRPALDIAGVEIASAPAMEAAFARLQIARRLRFACDFAGLGQVVPGLLRHGYAAADAGSARAHALLVPTLRMAMGLAKNYGHPDLAWSMARAMRTQAEALGDPAWLAFSDFVCAEAMPGPDNHVIALPLVTKAADELTPDTGSVAVAYGLLRLRAAAENVFCGDTPAALDLLDEAESVAERTGESDFADMSFGPRNVRIWRVGLAVEAGEPGRVPELARNVQPQEIPALSRRGSFHIDVGRGLATIRGREDEAVAQLRQAERTTPQRFRLNPFVRETVTDLLRRARRDAGGRELRGMAYRMGVGA